VPLPPLSSFELRVIEDLSPREYDGFLSLRRLRMVRCEAGTESAPFVFDHVERRALDAVVIAAHYLRDGQRWVYLRSAVRPALYLRPHECRPFEESETLGALWELPAGLVEPDECSRDGLELCAAREAGEELGFVLEPSAFAPLGPSSFPAPGIIGERHHYFHVQVDPNARRVPTGDGSVLEQDAAIVAVELNEALDLVRSGVLEDAKTELALRRLAEI
jgi:ADP-ribose pyrophosphatase